jgi:Kef-type K+ transport system membrane component KefB
VKKLVKVLLIIANIVGVILIASVIMNQHKHVIIDDKIMNTIIVISACFIIPLCSAVMVLSILYKRKPNEQTNFI